MSKIICGIPGCSRCKRIKEQIPDAKYIEFAPNSEALLGFCKAIGVTSMPLIVTIPED